MSWKTFGAWLLLLSVLVLGVAFLGYIFNNNTYKVYFDASGGNVIKPIEVKENELILKLPVTSRDGYKFIGWFLNDKLFELDTNITSNIYLVAKWEKIDQESFVIHFDSLNGEDIKDMQVKQEEAMQQGILQGRREGRREGMILSADIFQMVKKQPDLTNKQIAKNLGCSVEDVESTRKMFGI